MIILSIFRLRAAKVDDFVKALKQLHKDFEWPLPIVTLHTLRRMASGNVMDIFMAFAFCLFA